MKKMLFVAGVFCSLFVQGQDLILDNNNIPLNNSSSVTIDPNTGNIIATSLNGNLVCIDPAQTLAPTLSFNASPQTFTTQTSATLSWNVNNADSCQASGAWSGSKSSVDGSHQETIFNISQTSIFELTCSNAYGSVQKSAVVAKEGAPVQNPTSPIVSLSANPTQIQPSATVNLNWNISNATAQTTCQASGGWTGSQNATNGSHSASVNNVTPPKTFTLTCTTPGAPATVKSVTVSASGGSGSANCTNQPPVQLQRDTGFTSYSGATGGLVPGSATGAIASYKLDRNKYSALAFPSPGAGESHKVDFEQGIPGNGGPAAYTIAISECPGDFTTHLNQARCFNQGSETTIKWTTDPNDPLLVLKCLLEPNKNYYLNIVQSVDTNGGYQNSDCPGNQVECGVLFVEVMD